jgi:hypothetical protein
MFAAPLVIETKVFARVPDPRLLEGPSFDRAGNLEPAAGRASVMLDRPYAERFKGLNDYPALTPLSRTRAPGRGSHVA